MPGKSFIVLTVPCLIASLLSSVPSSLSSAQTNAILCTETALRSAVEAGGTIDLPQGCTYMLTADLPPITSDIAINGHDAIIDGSLSYQIFRVPKGRKMNVTLNRLTVQNGKSHEDGGGLSADEADITISRSIFSGNVADGRGGGAIYLYRGTLRITDSNFYRNSAKQSGGAIYASGVVEITNSAFAGNFAVFWGGAVDLGGGNLTITNSTVSGNESPGSVVSSIDGDISIVSSTIAGNVAETLSRQAVWTRGTLTLEQSIIAMYNPYDEGGEIVSERYNLIFGQESAYETGMWDETDLVGVDPKLGDAVFGVVALQRDSPAIDAVPAEHCATDHDQRGFSRPQGPACDIGAVEMPYYSDGTLGGFGLPDVQPVWGPIACSEMALRRAIRTGGTLELAPDCVYHLSADLPPIETSITIHGNNATIDGGGMYRLLYLPAPGDIVIDHLTVQYGHSERWGGGIFTRQGDVIIMDSAILNNVAEYDGGGVRAGGEGSVIVLNSTISGNVALEDDNKSNGGGIFARSVTIAHSTVTGNSALYSGGGVWADQVVVTDSTFTSNWAQHFYGGAILASEAHITRSTFAHNLADSDWGEGGAIRAGTAFVSDSVFHHNQAGLYGGAIRAPDMDIANGVFVANSTISDSFNMDFTPGGGAIYGSNITVDHSLFKENSADNVGEYSSGSGGAIFTYGTLRLTNSTLVGNTAQESGGAVYHTYGGKVYIANSTIARNSSGIEVRAATADIFNSTIVNNEGIGLFNGGRWDGGWHNPGTVYLSQSIVTGNETDIRLGSDVILYSLGYNLLGTVAGRMKAARSDMISLQYGLDVFNGEVYPLTPASLALDAVPLSECTSGLDQRGTPRPQGDACDIGAVEMPQTSDGALISIPSPELPDIPVFDRTQPIEVGCTEVELRQAVARGGTLNLPSECVYFLRGSLPPITTDTVINGNGVVIDAQGNRIFFVEEHADLSLYDLTLARAVFRDNTATDRSRSQRGGGVYVMSGDVTIRNSAFTGGSDIYVARGNVVIDQVTFPDAERSRFSVYVGEGDVTITNTTLRVDYPAWLLYAVYVEHGDVTISSSTCFLNVGALGRDSGDNIVLISYHRAGWDGPCFHVDRGSLTLEQTIAATNQADLGPLITVRGRFESRGYNLLTTDGGLPLLPTDIVNLEHGLGVFDGTGFPLTATSPALDAVPPGECATTVDQRGVARPQGKGCDIGAVEME